MDRQAAAARPGGLAPSGSALPGDDRFEIFAGHDQPAESGWLSGLRDPFVGKALSLIHRSLARNWTIEELAREVGVSRSVLAERFADIVGLPPMHYLAKWRMQVASELLSGGGTNIATVAEDGGCSALGVVSRSRA